MSPTDRPQFTIRIDPEGLSVSLVVTSGQMERIPKDAILALLKEHSITVAAEDEKRIDRALRPRRKSAAPDREAVIVKGVGPIHGCDGHVIDLVAKHALPVDQRGNVSHYDHNVLRVVDAGEPVLEIIPPAPHTPGRDIFGREVPAMVGLPAKLDLNGNLARSEDGRIVTATAAGRFQFRGGVAWVEPDLRIEGDVAFTTGNVDFEGDVIVKNDVLDQFQVKTPQNVTIEGAVEGATIDAGKDVTVSGGIHGRGKGFIAAGGTITCRFANAARLTAGADIAVARYVYDSELSCEGRLLMPDGVLSGGKASCLGGAVIGTLGSNAQGKTVISMGVDERLPLVTAAIEGDIRDAEERIAEESRVLEPYRKRLQSLRGAERRTAAEIVARIRELQGLIDDRRAELERITTRAHEMTGSTLEVRERIFPGVVVVFDGAKTRFRDGRTGPVRIEARRAGGLTEVVAIDLRTNESSILPCEDRELAA